MTVTTEGKQKNESGYLTGVFLLLNTTSLFNCIWTKGSRLLSFNQRHEGNIIMNVFVW